MSVSVDYWEDVEAEVGLVWEYDLAFELFVLDIWMLDLSLIFEIGTELITVLRCSNPAILILPCAKWSTGVIDDSRLQRAEWMFLVLGDKT